MDLPSVTSKDKIPWERDFVSGKIRSVLCKWNKNTKNERNGFSMTLLINTYKSSYSMFFKRSENLLIKNKKTLRGISKILKIVERDEWQIWEERKKKFGLNKTSLKKLDELDWIRLKINWEIDRK